MPSNTETAKPDTKAPTAFTQSIEEFCQNHSSTVKLPEMIYAFSKDEEANGRYFDTAANYLARFEAFGSRVSA